MNKKEYKKNLAYLKENDISLCGEKLWGDKPWSVELETRTDGGGNMIIDLEEPTKECLEKYIDDFDIDEEVVLWWRDGYDAAKKKGVPFSNIRDHYNDYDHFLDKLQDICDNWPD